MTEQTKRDQMLQRVLNLRARAENDASSESEMNAAFGKAAKMMDAYNIEEAELALAENEGRIVLEVITKAADTSALKGKQRHKIVSCLHAISNFTQTRDVYSRYDGVISFTGHRPDVELANYLTALVRQALDSEYEAYRKSNVSVGRGAKASFQVAMVSRINSRLYKLSQEAEEERENNKKAAKQKQIENGETGTSTALIVSDIAEQKRKEVEIEYKKANPRVRTAPGFSYGSNRTAHSAGRSAGDRVNFGRPMGGSANKRLA